MPPADDPMVAAVSRDLGLTVEQARALLATQERATQVEETLRGGLPATYGGTWIDESSGELRVGVTDLSSAQRVRDAGAVPYQVDYLEAELDLTVAELDAATEPAPDSVTGWYVDVAVNRVLVQTMPGTAAEARAYLDRTLAQPGAAVVEETDEEVAPMADLHGGDAYFSGGGRCSIGFSVTGGFVTAGHCGTAGTAVRGLDPVDTGTVAAASFPGDDFGWARTNASWRQTPTVNLYNGGGTTPVLGAREAPRGAPVCRSGSTNGFDCGLIRGKNKTVKYREGKVRGLTKTNICSSGGDSGGSFIIIGQAQGMTSGGSTRCNLFTHSTYFQPVNEALQRYGLTLTVQRPCRGMTWSVATKEWGRDVTLVGRDFHTDAYNGDTPCDRTLPVACLQPAGLPVPPGITPTANSGWTGGNMRLSAPVRGSSLTSRAAADAVCAGQFGAGWRMGEFHDGGGGWAWWALGDPQRMWVAINDQPANPWNTTTGRAMTWTLGSHQWGADVVDVMSDFKTNAYNGDTPTTAALPVLCLRRDGRPVPPGITPTANNGWAQGQVQLTAPIAGRLLTSRLRADAFCMSQFGLGWRMAEFHDGGGGWAYWAAGDIGRMWVAINDQPANPWS